ncbi:hypothetical protein [Candidatus Hydrogenosomobacter endosymbioticus]|uniref:Uncharacterized protein n=1 Tax=Candidatus Hydrogenosomobacter endosymbioticus TaxID=2558174 RepID=A0ABM7V8F4_9PROT|nr:hypothetical protein [Candidatus Hydrogenosomobacter endosymbioticus]BDB96059.1 hypothetical protein HYD_1920 [Candidatus Hydrogenosomobacter endosymbioticus]
MNKGLCRFMVVAAAVLFSGSLEASAVIVKNHHTARKGLPIKQMLRRKSKALANKKKLLAKIKRMRSDRERQYARRHHQVLSVAFSKKRKPQSKMQGRKLPHTKKVRMVEQVQPTISRWASRMYSQPVALSQPAKSSFHSPDHWEGEGRLREVSPSPVSLHISEPLFDLKTPESRATGVNEMFKEIVQICGNYENALKQNKTPMYYDKLQELYHHWLERYNYSVGGGIDDVKRDLVLLKQAGRENELIATEKDLKDVTYKLADMAKQALDNLKKQAAISGFGDISFPIEGGSVTRVYGATAGHGAGKSFESATDPVDFEARLR